MKKSLLIALAVVLILGSVLTYFIYTGKITPLQDNLQESMPTNEHSVNEGTLGNNSQPCDKINDSSLRDDCYKNEAFATFNTTPCSKIIDKEMRKDCILETGDSDSGSATKGGSGGGGGAGGGGGGQSPGGTENITEVRIVDVISAYKCGPDICFQLKASGQNTEDAEIGEVSYYINGLSSPWIGWDNNGEGDSCTDKSLLEPSQTCFGKVPGNSCITGDIFEARFAGIKKSIKELGECI
jgi:hypothetical protein